MAKPEKDTPKEHHYFQDLLDVAIAVGAVAIGAGLLSHHFRGHH